MASSEQIQIKEAPSWDLPVTYIKEILSYIGSEDSKYKKLRLCLLYFEEAAFYPLEKIWTLGLIILDLVTPRFAQLQQGLETIFQNGDIIDSSRLYFQQLQDYLTWRHSLRYITTAITVVILGWMTVKFIFRPLFSKTYRNSDVVPAGDHCSLQSRKVRNESVGNNTSHLVLSPLESPWWRSLHRIILSIILCSFIMSIPWEFMRIYQEEVAKRVAVSVKVRSNID